MKAFWLTIFLVTLAVANHQRCEFTYEAVLAWTNDRFYDQSPFIIGGYDSLKNNLEMSDTQIEAMRQGALAWFKYQFGVPTETAIFNSTSKTTTVPNWGYMDTVFFNSSYELTASDGAVADCTHLAIGEFTFFMTNTNLNYGGRFGRLLDLYVTGGSKRVVAGDGFSFGYYYLMRPGKAKIFKKIAMKAVYPTRADISFRSHEELYLTDTTADPGSNWGAGHSYMQLAYQVGPAPSYLQLSQINGYWKFGNISDIYTLYGL